MLGLEASCSPRHRQPQASAAPGIGHVRRRLQIPGTAQNVSHLSGPDLPSASRATNSTLMVRPVKRDRCVSFRAASESSSISNCSDRGDRAVMIARVPGSQWHERCTQCNAASS